MRFYNYMIIESGDTFSSKSNIKYTTWKCLCDCGIEFNIRTKEIKKGRKSCGCLNKSNQYKKVSSKECILNLKINHYKNSAKKRNLLFSLNSEEFYKLLIDNCYYCGQPPSLLVNRHSHTMLINGIDRKNSKEGYIRDNVVTCCKTCNYAKSDSSLMEFENWINNLIKYRTDDTYNNVE